MRFWIVANNGRHAITAPFRSQDDLQFALRMLVRQGYACHIVEH